jgi:hypothetical protein
MIKINLLRPVFVIDCLNLTSLKAIRKWCIKCQDSQKAPKFCVARGCHFWAFREGRNPNRKIPRLPPQKKDLSHTKCQNESKKGIVVVGSGSILIEGQNLKVKQGGIK